MFETIANNVASAIISGQLGSSKARIFSQKRDISALEENIKNHVRAIFEAHRKLSIYRKKSDEILDAFVKPNAVERDLGGIFLSPDVAKNITIPFPDLATTKVSEETFENYFRPTLAAITQAISSSGIDVGKLDIDCECNTVILAPPGGGKSTSISYTLVRSLSEGSLRLPFYFNSEQFRQNSVTELVEAQLTRLGYQTPKIGEISSKAVLFIDGLDEVSLYRLKEICAEIRVLTDQHADLRVIASCRTAAYDGELSSFREVTLLPFEKAQVSSFLDIWFRDETGPKNSAKLYAKVSSDTRLMEIATQPLMLCLMCNAFDRYLDISNRVTALYDQCLDALFWSWDANRSIERDEPFSNVDIEKRKWLHAYVAFKIHQKRKRYADERELIQWVTEYSTRLGLENSDVSRLVWAMSSNVGIIERLFERLFGFRHLGLQEYLAAKWISQESRWKTVLCSETISDIWWREVVGLCIGCLSDSTECVKHILDIEGSTRLEKLEVICASLRYDPIIDPNLRRRVLMEVLRLYHNSPDSREQHRASRMILGINDAWSSPIIKQSLGGQLP